MAAIRQGPFLVEGTRAAAAEGGTVRLTAADAAALKGVETLVLPEIVTAFIGLGSLPALKTVICRGGGDVLGLAEGVEWLAERTGDGDALLQRLATNMLAAPPIAPGLTAIVAPRMAPLHALPAYRRLMEAIDDLAACSNGRQDSARQNVCLCLSFGGMKRLEYAMDMGLAVSPEPYPAETAALYPDSARFAPREQLIYALALAQGSSYQDFYTADGDCGYHTMTDRAGYLSYLERRLTWEDSEGFRQCLLSLLDAGLLCRNNYQAAVELLTARRLTEATAFLLDQGARRPGLVPPADVLEAEFSL